MRDWAGSCKPRMPLECSDWTLTKVQPTETVGNNPSYGVVTMLEWTGPSAGGNGATQLLRHGIGLLLAGGTGMAADLRAKFDLFHKRSLGAQRLTILWNTQREGDDLAQLLPPATKKVWDESGYRKRAAIHQLTQDDLCVFVAFPDWLGSVREEAPEAVPDLHSFVQQQFAAFIQLIAGDIAGPAEKGDVDED